jgi:anti-sigma B factor antagonist
MQREHGPFRPLERFARPGAPLNLDIQVSYRLGVPVLYLTGELDSATSPTLRAALEQEIAAGHPIVLLEGNGLVYIDSAGLNLLFDMARRLRDQGWLGLVGAHARVTKLVELTGLTEQAGFRLAGDLAEAATALPRQETPEEG